MNKRDGYHSDRSEGQQVVVPVAVAPAVPAGVLALLQDVHLSAEVHLLPTHPTKKERNGGSVKRHYWWVTHISVSREHSRAALHAEGTHSIHAHFTHVHALIGDLDHAALKVLLIIHIHLRDKKEKKIRSVLLVSQLSIKVVSLAWCKHKAYIQLPHHGSCFYL